MTTCLFQSEQLSPDATYGTAGVLSYDISGNDYKLVIMWEVPWNSLMYNTKFNVKVGTITN